MTSKYYESFKYLSSVIEGLARRMIAMAEKEGWRM